MLRAHLAGAGDSALPGRDHDARRHGVRRHLRPPRRRLRPLLGRRALAGAPLREDALRPGPAHAGLPARLAGHRRGQVPPGGGGHDRLRAAGPAPSRRRASTRPRTRTPRARRAASTSGRPTRSAPSSAPDLGQEAMAWYGVTEAGNFEGRTILHRPVRGDLLRPERVEEARARLLEVRGRRIRPGLDDKVLTEWNALDAGRAGRVRRGHGRGDWLDAAPRQRRAPDRPPAPRGRPLAALLAARRRSPPCRAGRRPRRADRGASSRLATATGEARWIDGGHGGGRHPPRPLLGCLARRGLHDGGRRRGAHRPPEGPDGQRHPGRQLAGRHRPDPPGGPHR